MGGGGGGVPTPNERPIDELDFAGVVKDALDSVIVVLSAVGVFCTAV